MNFEPLATAPLPVQLHVAAVVPAAIIGAVILFCRKGTRLHKMLGRVCRAHGDNRHVEFLHSSDRPAVGFQPDPYSVGTGSGRMCAGGCGRAERANRCSPAHYAAGLSRRYRRCGFLCVYAGPHHECGIVSAGRANRRSSRPPCPGTVRPCLAAISQAAAGSSGFRGRGLRV